MHIKLHWSLHKKYICHWVHMLKYRAFPEIENPILFYRYIGPSWVICFRKIIILGWQASYSWLSPFWADSTSFIKSISPFLLIILHTLNNSLLGWQASDSYVILTLLGAGAHDVVHWRNAPKWYAASCSSWWPWLFDQFTAYFTMWSGLILCL